MQILSCPGFQDCIKWTDDGKGFVFIDQEKFISRNSKVSSTQEISRCMKSFVRKLNRWGFKMNLKKGPSYGIYVHEYFNKYKPWLCDMMVCGNQNELRKVESDLKVVPSENNFEKRQKMDICPLNTESEESRSRINKVEHHDSNIIFENVDSLLLIETKIQLVNIVIAKKIMKLNMQSI